MLVTAAFYGFSAILIGSAAGVVTARNPVHSVLLLILAFFNAAALFLIAGAEFLAMILVIVYVGAVAVLFLFVVMMLDVDFSAFRSGFQRYLPAGIAVGGVLLAELLAIAGGARFGLGGSAIAPVITGAGASQVSNTAAIGRVIYTQYVFLFQSAGLVLLVAMIGAIVLTLRDRRTSKRQNVGDQVNRRVGDTLALVDAKLHGGIETVYRPLVAEVPRTTPLVTHDVPVHAEPHA